MTAALTQAEIDQAEAYGLTRQRWVEDSQAYHNAQKLKALKDLASRYGGHHAEAIVFAATIGLDEYIEALRMAKASQK